jgi:uncharacterized membrane protein YidH (DUF202 family)
VVVFILRELPGVPYSVWSVALLMCAVSFPMSAALSMVALFVASRTGPSSAKRLSWASLLILMGIIAYAIANYRWGLD